jgi:hypothetical protein
MSLGAVSRMLDCTTGSLRPFPAPSAHQFVSRTNLNALPEVGAHWEMGKVAYNFANCLVSSRRRGESGKPRLPDYAEASRTRCLCSAKPNWAYLNRSSPIRVSKSRSVTGPESILTRWCPGCSRISTARLCDTAIKRSFFSYLRNERHLHSASTRVGQLFPQSTLMVLPLSITRLTSIKVGPLNALILSNMRPVLLQRPASNLRFSHENQSPEQDPIEAPK